jgi:hypothetical protein
VQGDAVVAIVDADIRSLADPVAHPVCEHGCPESLVTFDVSAAYCYAVEAFDTGIARREVTPAGV